MQRFTVTLNGDLAEQCNTLIAAKGYVNRSLTRGLIRPRLVLPAAGVKMMKPHWLIAVIGAIGVRAADTHRYRATDACDL